LLIGVHALSFAQISVSKSTVSFPKTMYGDSAVTVVNVSNQSTTSITFEADIYHPDFILSESTFLVAAGEKKALVVTFKPKHNIRYNTELIIRSFSRYGSLRVDILGEGKYDAYYASTFNLFEEDLKNELKSVISRNYVNLGYNGARDRMYASIDNVGGKVTCVYTGRTATFNTRSGANSNSFNCEHTWPQSLFNKREPERADIHHLFPTDVNSNSRRGSYPFGVVSSSSWSEGGSKQGGSMFEPRNDHKGDVARAMFYFATRYQNYSGFLTSQESILRSWALQQPPSQKSIDRNNAIYAVQKNRNPYVDYPEFLSRIKSISTNSVADKVTGFEPSVNEIILHGDTIPGQWTYPLFITNTGNQPITITDITRKEANTILPATRPTIAPGESVELSIIFENIGDGFLDEIEITANGMKEKILVNMNWTLGMESKPPVKPFVYVSDAHIVLHKVTSGNVTLYDMAGRKIYFNDILSPFTEIDRTKFPSGTYFVQIITDNGARSVHRVVIP